MPLIGEVDEREEGVMEWTVRDFFSVPPTVDEFYLSPPFSFGGEQWQLSMFPNGQNNKSEGCIDVYLIRTSDGPPIELNCSFGLKTSTNEVDEERHGTQNFEKQLDAIGWCRFLWRSELVERQSELATSGHLTWVCRLKRTPSTDAASEIPTAKCIHCKDTVDAGKLPSHERKCVEKPIRCPDCSDVVPLKHWYAHECQPAQSKGKASGPVVKSKVLQDLKQLFENQDNCDVVLRVKGWEFPAHRAILTSRSSVFSSAFRHDMKPRSKFMLVFVC